ncbi:MAG: hypothetical protein WAM09_09540 [Anaerolineales bacterium]
MNHIPNRCLKTSLFAATAQSKKEAEYKVILDGSLRKASTINGNQK